jgi:hypothetical protein
VGPGPVGQPPGRGFVKLLELSGVGRVVADGTDEDGAHAAVGGIGDGREDGP